MKYDYFTGDIIHRLVAALDVNGSYYTLTKGDNNPVLAIYVSLVFFEILI